MAGAGAWARHGEGTGTGATESLIVAKDCGVRRAAPCRSLSSEGRERGSWHWSVMCGTGHVTAVTLVGRPGDQRLDLWSTRSWPMGLGRLMACLANYTISVEMFGARGKRGGGPRDSGQRCQHLSVMLVLGDTFFPSGQSEAAAGQRAAGTGSLGQQTTDRCRRLWRDGMKGLVCLSPGRPVLRGTAGKASPTAQGRVSTDTATQTGTQLSCLLLPAQPSVGVVDNLAAVDNTSAPRR